MTRSQKTKTKAAAASIMEAVAALSEGNQMGTRLVADVPIDGGDMRLTLVQGEKRTTVWGTEIGSLVGKLIRTAEATD